MMKYQIKLELLSDSELETLLHLEVDEDFKIAYADNKHNKYWRTENIPNYCSSYNEIMPLAFEHEIDFMHINNEGKKFYRCLSYTYKQSERFDDFIKAYHKNPLRAAVIILLLIKMGDE